MPSLVLLNLKTELKLAAHLIKEKKAIWRKLNSRLAKTGGELTPYRNGELGSLETQIAKLQWAFRSKHIAYCMLRGKTLEQIEGKKGPCKAPYCKATERCDACGKYKVVKIIELYAEYAKLFVAEKMRNALSKGYVGETLRIDPS